MPKGKNFTEIEKMLLEELVDQHKSIIENKQTDSLTVMKKKTTWNRIAFEFNDKLKNSQKDVTQLKKLWENIKFRRKTDRRSSLQKKSTLHFASTSDENPYIDYHTSLTELTDNMDSESLLLEPQTLMVVKDDASQQNADFVIDLEEDAVMCSGGSTSNNLNIKKEHSHSKSTCSEDKPELDSHDLQNQIVPSPYSLVEYKNPDVTSDDCAVDIKEETWWHTSISPNKLQPELSLLSQDQITIREDEESVHESNTTTSKNINGAMPIPTSYAWNAIPASIQPKYRSKSVARAIAELNQLQESVNKNISENQFDIFGRSVASQLKTIQYYRALEVQSQIQTLLTNIAIETFRSSKS